MSQSQGFLSDTLSNSIANIRRDFAPWFKAASAFNNLGMQVLPAVKADRANNQQLVAAVLFGRTLTSFQAAYLLAERGMLADARTIARAAAETAIILCALNRDAAVCDLLIQRHDFHHRRYINAWLNDPQAVAEMSREDVARLNAVIDEIDRRNPSIAQKTSDPVNVWTLAQKAGVTPLYNVVYRGASGDAAHTSPDALNRHVKADAGGNILGLKVGPETGDLAATLFDVMSVLGHAVHAVLELFQLQEFRNDLDRCIASSKALGVPADYKPGARGSGDVASGKPKG
ncbi:DUF5677 domain-containing protein [Ralstonia pseudosolanacearum]|uniref:DUF5677 domain-containing protein n=1 Tax=Ralstonia pseudosolanacearum TaxID=1310165 RepID=UPI0007D77358|nr:DUF5677 domain-containing protein [Ralstonia pseudosolanacearum]MDD7787802.1 DUF5677 domain-containing protein [Ralstonia pseudosolanacearum]MDN3369422.1 DUF5677 domain-containing protein [Ralstonia pseudosolanacearum]OAK89625.1 hypothetical protein AB851_19090 [Ralstonia pseudosolanacearum]QOK89137.1 hypothetical protein HF907_21170 [Ralstonia pseudosolanacearum]